MPIEQEGPAVVRPADLVNHLAVQEAVVEDRHDCLILGTNAPVDVNSAWHGQILRRELTISNSQLSRTRRGVEFALEIAVASWELGVGSWELSVGRWELGVVSWPLRAGRW